MGLVLLGAVLKMPGVAQDMRYLRHQGWTTEDGLPQDSVHGVVQTSDGFLWVGTEGGLVRFDGSSFRLFNQATERAFSSNDVSCLLQGEDGALWVGTADGLVRVEEGGERLTHFGTAEGLPATSVLALRRGSTGNVGVDTDAGWATWQGGRFQAASGPTPSMRRELAGSGGGWVATDAVVTWKQGERTERWDVGKELPGSRVESFLHEPSAAGEPERAWVGTNAGLFLLRAGQPRVFAAPWLRGDAVLALASDSEGDLWVGTESGGLHVLRPARFRTEAALGGGGVVTLVESGDTVWLGSRRDGVRAVRMVASPQREGDSGQETDTAVRDLGRAGMTSAVVLSLAPASNGGVWVGTPDGLNLAGAKGDVREASSADGLPDDYVLALAADGGGGVWAGTRRGLAHVVRGRTGTLDVSKVITRADGLPGDLVGAVLCSRGGMLWIATLGGVSTLDESGTIRSVASRWGHGVVRSLAEDQAGSVWLGTSDGWVGRVRRDGSVTGERATPGGEAVDGLAVAGGEVWLRTTRGIEVLDVDAYERCTRAGCQPPVTEYGVPEGMPSAEEAGVGQPMVWRMATGELWFGTRHRVAIADPAVAKRVSLAPPVVIERFVADGTELPVASGERDLKVAYGHVHFTVEYAGLNFQAPGQVRYRYKLEGLDKAWTEAGGRRSASYTNLRPGRYQFQVEAADGSGGWGEPGAELHFEVIPPFYRTWWFVLLMVVCGAALVIGLYLLRLRRLRREFDAVLRERNRMAREIHDTLAQDFVGVSLKLDIALKMLDLGKTDAAVGQIRETRMLVTEGLQEARQSIWDLRANASADSLPAQLTRIVERYRSEGLEIRLRVSGAYRALDQRVEGEAVRVVQEALQNVKRHAGVERAGVELEYRSAMLVLTIADEGRGFHMSDAERKEGHYGVRGMRERAASVGGDLLVTTEEGQGTRVQFLCPIAAGTPKGSGKEAEL